MEGVGSGRARKAYKITKQRVRASYCQAGFFSVSQRSAAACAECSGHAVGADSTSCMLS